MLWIVLFWALFVGMGVIVFVLSRRTSRPLWGIAIFAVMLLWVFTATLAGQTAEGAFSKSFDYAGYLSLFLFFVVCPCLAIWYRLRRRRDEKGLEENWDGPSTH